MLDEPLRIGNGGVSEGINEHSLNLIDSQVTVSVGIISREYNVGLISARLEAQVLVLVGLDELDELSLGDETVAVGVHHLEGSIELSLSYGLAHLGSARPDFTSGQLSITVEIKDSVNLVDLLAIFPADQ